MKLATAALLVIALSLEAQSQTNVLSLAEAKRAALENGWDILAAKSGVDSATAQLIITKEFPNPTASLSTARIGSHENATPMGNSLWDRNYDSIAAISQLFEIAGKRRHRQNAARAGILGARARFYDAKRTLDQGVTKAYMAALLAEDNVLIYSQSSGYLQRQAKIAEERFKAGDISDADKKQIEINAGQYELQAKAAEAAAIQARVAVEVLMGVKAPKGQWTPAEPLESLMARPPSPSGVRPIAGAARSDVLAAQADLQSAEATLRLQKALRVPDPTVSIQGEHNPPGGGPPVDTVGLMVSFPVPLWNRNGGAIQAAQASVAQSEIALARVRAQVVADVADAQAEYREARARWERYRDELGLKSTQVRESVAFAYGKGGASLVNLLDAERTDNDVRLATAQAMSDTASAVADLEAAQSVLSESELRSQK
jgi:cobalt-zinc-cadmium efflux system outer membrane protein